MAKHNRKKEEILDVEVEKMSSTGKGLFRRDGEVIFVNDSIPGDIVDIRIHKKKKNFSEASIIDIKKKSDLRIEPVCGHFDLCGGCKWQNLSYEKQLEYKEDQVRDALERLGSITNFEVLPILGCEETLQYRNKLEYTFTSRRWFERDELKTDEYLDGRGVGFHIPGNFDKIVDIETCHLQKEPTNEIRNFIKEWGRKNDISFYNIKLNKGLLRNLIIRITSEGQLMVILQFGEDQPEVISDLVEKLKSEFPAIHSMYYVINTKKNEIFSDLDMVHVMGEPFITEVMKAPKRDEVLKFRISPKSFYQTNSIQAEKLYKMVYDLTELKGDELVYDLYTGTGTIACYLSSYAKKVVGIEYVEQAVNDAYLNAELNGLENLEFYHGDMSKILNASFIEKVGKPDIVITDPPRAGMHQDVVQTLLDCAPERIIYVSCNPSTQARDLQLMAEKYEIVTVQPVDMFPQTPHVENIVSLKLKA